MVDKPLVLRKLSELDGYLTQIREFSAVSVDEYREDWKIQRIVERTFQMLIELCVDVANHIIADRHQFPWQKLGLAFRQMKLPIYREGDKGDEMYLIISGCPG